MKEIIIKKKLSTHFINSNLQVITNINERGYFKKEVTL